MAEPVNTPMPASTPLAGTPRSQSPIQHVISKLHGHSLSTSSPTTSSSAHEKLIVLHIGDPIKYNPETYEQLSSSFQVIRPSTKERQRPEFIKALRDKRWGEFHAIFRPFWGTGGEMGKWDAELIELLPSSVRVFASAGAGFDWADTKLMGEKGIIYCNSGLAAAESVADFAVAMIISTFRHLPWTMAAAMLPFHATPNSATMQQDGNIEAAFAKAFQSAHEDLITYSRNPRGHTLGIIGLGKIGQLVAAKMGHPTTFGMAIHYYDVVRQPEGIESRLGATYHSTLESLLRTSDCTVLATPASTDGKPLITAETLSWFKPGSRFINVARGSLVDEDALADALEEGRISAAALDVHADEPRISRRLINLAGVALPGFGGTASPSTTVVSDMTEEDGKNKSYAHPGRVMLTCHNAGGTLDAHIGFEELSMRNIMAVLGGGKPVTPVNMHFLKEKETTELR